MNWMIEELRSFMLPVRPASRYRWLAYVLLAIGLAGLVQARIWHEWYAPIASLSWPAIMLGSSIGLGVPVIWLASLGALLIPGVVRVVAFANAGLDRQLHETYYVATRIPFVGLVVVVFILIATVYRYLSRKAGYRYNEYLGMLHFCMTFIGLALMLAPERLPFNFLMMPGSYTDYPEAFSIWNRWWWYGLTLVALGSLIFASILIDTYRRKQPV